MSTLAMVEDDTDTLVMGSPKEMERFAGRLRDLGFEKDKDGVADPWTYRIPTHKLDPRTRDMLHQHLLPYLTGGTGTRRKPSPNRTPHVQIEDIDGVTYVSGPRHIMWDVVNKRLKSQGFTWDPAHTTWWIYAMDMTPLKRKNLEKLLAPYVEGGGADTRSPQEKVRDTVLERSKAGLCLFLPFDLKDEAKAAGGIWGEPTLGKKVWCMPDKASYDAIKDLADKHPSVAIPREITRRKTERLGLPGLPFEMKDEAKSRGGLWDADGRVWYMPDESSKKEVLGLVQNERDKTEAMAREVAQKHLEQEQARRESRGEVTLYQEGDSRGDHWPVGHVFHDRKKGKVLRVTDVKSQYIREDGMSFGMDRDSGWQHTLTAEPVGQETSDRVLKEVAEKETKAQVVKDARKRRRDLADNFRKHGTMPSGTHTLHGERLLLEGQDSLAYGGGSWFVVEGGTIWYVQNNGHDGDAWGNNNVETGGAGAMGWKLPHDGVVIQEILDLDKLIGEGH